MAAIEMAKGKEEKDVFGGIIGIVIKLVTTEESSQGHRKIGAV